MRFFTRVAVAGMLLIIVPLGIAVATVVLRANDIIHELVERNARLELEFFLEQAEREYSILERLGIAGTPFYETNAKTVVLQYAAERNVSGGFLFARTNDGSPVLIGGAVRDEDLVLTVEYEPWDWELGIAISDEYVGGFVREAVGSVVVLALLISAGAIVVLWFAARRISRPIERLEKSAARVAGGEFSARAPVSGSDEVARLATTFNRMAERVEALTSDLEAQVEARTQELQRSLEELQATQELLVQRERMASLGRLVAGIAHEINTPIGIGVTSSTFLSGQAERWLSRLERAQEEGRGPIDSDDMIDFVRDAADAASIVHRSLQRAEELVATFRKLAVDQSSGQSRTFDLCAYVRDIVHSLRPQTKKYKAAIHVRCDRDIVINSYPGHFYQILTNLVLNSLIHGIGEEREGTITISIGLSPELLTIRHGDDGVGMGEEQRTRAFEPFYTTKMGTGGSGLGLNIVFNTVNHSLGGTITIDSTPGQGTVLEISIPRSGIVVEDRAEETSS